MNNRKNILFSTTRQWNPGDEFILMGVLNVLRSMNVDFNPVIFNRNPEIQRGSSIVLSLSVDSIKLRVKRLKPGYYDNSFKKNLMQDKFIDIVIFAGTPEWASPRLKILYEYIAKHAIPVVYLGVGLGHAFDLKTLPLSYESVYKTAKLFTTRDEKLKDLLADQKVQYIPCPALLSAPSTHEKKITKVEKVALIYGDYKSAKNNRVDEETYRYMINLYSTLLERYKDQFDFEFVCHYVDELPSIKKDFDKYSYHYSYDARDYIDIYNKFDLVIGQRVHGIGIAASMGIPGISIGHDMRRDACKGFCADIVDVATPISDFFELFDLKVRNVVFLNKSILDHKHQVFERYVTLLTPIIQEI